MDEEPGSPNRVVPVEVDCEVEDCCWYLVGETDGTDANSLG